MQCVPSCRTAMRHIWHCAYMDDTSFASCTTCGRQAIHLTGQCSNVCPHFPYLTSDVVRCHQMSYQTLFTNRLSLSNFAKSESDNGKELTSLDHSTPQASRSNPTIGGFSVQANRASCVLVRQKVFCPTRTNLPAQRGGGIRSKVADSGREKSTNQKSHVYGENNRDKDGQKA